MGPLTRPFFARPTVDVARDLLGMLVVRRLAEGIAAGAIVEVEAYGGPDDRASHARAGRTRRTAPMFGPPGHAYVYVIYGLHHCLNVVAETDGLAGAVLIRALAPVTGAELMRTYRARPNEAETRLAAGPARLCQALAIDRSLDSTDLTSGGALFVAHPGLAALAAARRPGIVAGPRIGVAYAGGEWAERAWRFGIAGHPSLSRGFPRARVESRA